MTGSYDAPSRLGGREFARGLLDEVADRSDAGEEAPELTHATSLLHEDDRQIIGAVADERVRSDSTLSARACGVDKRGVLRADQQTEFSRRKWVRGLAFCAAIPLGGRNTRWGSAWRKISPWLCTAATVTGLALAMTGVGAPAGMALLWSGVGLGAAARMQSMADLTVQYQQDKEAGRNPDWKAAAALMLGNAFDLALTVVPVATPFVHIFKGVLGSIFAGGRISASIISGIDQARRSRPASARDIVPVEGPVAYFDPLTKTEAVIGAGEFARKMRAPVHALAYADPSTFYSVREERGKKVRPSLQEAWSQALRHMAKDGQVSVGLCGLIVDLINDGRQDNDDITPADRDFPVQASSGLRAAKIRLWNEAVDATKKTRKDPRVVYRNELQALRARCSEELGRRGLDPAFAANWRRARQYYLALPEELTADAPPGAPGTHMTYDGAFVDRGLGNRSALVLDMSVPDRPVAYHSVAGIGAALPGEGPKRMGTRQTVQAVGSALDMSAGADLDDLARLTRTLQDAVGRANANVGSDADPSVGMAGPAAFALFGYSQGGAKAAYASALTNIPAYTADALELGSASVARLTELGIDWRQRWLDNLVAFGLEGEGIQDRRRMRGVTAQVSYPVFYRFAALPAHLEPRNTLAHRMGAIDNLHGAVLKLVREGYHVEHTEAGVAQIVRARDGLRRDASSIANRQAMRDWAAGRGE